MADEDQSARDAQSARRVRGFGPDMSYGQLQTASGPVARPPRPVPCRSARLVSRDCGNDRLPVSQIVVCGRNPDFLWFRSTELCASQAVAFETILTASRPLGAMANKTWFFEVPGLAKPSRMSTRNNERRIVFFIHRMCPQHSRWSGSALRFQRYAGPFPFFPTKPSGLQHLALCQVRPITERT